MATPEEIMRQIERERELADAPERAKRDVRETTRLALNEKLGQLFKFLSSKKRAGSFSNVLPSPGEYGADGMLINGGSRWYYQITYEHVSYTERDSDWTRICFGYDFAASRYIFSESQNGVYHFTAFDDLDKLQEVTLRSLAKYGIL